MFSGLLVACASIGWLYPVRPHAKCLKQSLRFCLAVEILLAVCPLASASATEEVTDRLNILASGNFVIYEQNRKDGTPNYITEDFILLGYSMIRVDVMRSREREVLAPLLRELISALEQGHAAAGEDAVALANRDFIAVLRALVDGNGEVGEAGDRTRAQTELDIVLAASEVAPSALWDRSFDYSQFRPRGYYAEDDSLARYFRTIRYAGGVLFPVVPSEATGVSAEQAHLASLQSRTFVDLIENDAELAALYGAFVEELTWQYGPSDDLTNSDLRAIPVEPAHTFGQRLLDHARENGIQPRILGDLVDRSKLEPGRTLADVVTGWRLLSQRRTPESEAFQGMVFDGTGPYESLPEAEAADNSIPDTLTLIDGQLVKGFPLLAELMCMWGNQLSCRNLRDQGESRFDAYWDAIGQGRRILASAEGLARLERPLMVYALSHCAGYCEDRLTAMRAFWTWQRYASALHAKQSYTPTGKGIALQPLRRRGARVEPSLAIYMALARMVEGHRQHTPHPSWDAFAVILDRMIDIAARHDMLSVADETFLNNVDAELKALTGGPDEPIVVDIHTNAARGEVLYEATGLARVIDEDNRPWSKEGTARGARFSQCEFFAPLGERLTDAEWRLRLQGQPTQEGNPFQIGTPCGEVDGRRQSGMEAVSRRQYLTPSLSRLAAQKLDGRLLSLAAFMETDGAQAISEYAAENGIDMRDGAVTVRIIAESENLVDSIKMRIKLVGGEVKAAFENNVYARVRIDTIGELAFSESIYRIDLDEAIISPIGQVVR